MFALYEQGYTAKAIAEKCAGGMASVGPFQIPRRTVHGIVTEMARERGTQLPQSVKNATEDAAARYPDRVCRLLEGEIDRLERKMKLGKPVDANELERVTKGLTAYERAQRLCGGSQRRPGGGIRSTGNGGPPEKEESFVQKLARQERERQEQGASDNGSAGL
jgi:hypothetical protein